MGLRLSLLTAVLQTETLHLPGPQSSTTGGRALAPLPCPPVGLAPLTLHHCSLCLQYRVAADTAALTSLLRLRLSLVTAVLGLQLLSSPLVETLHSPPPEAATTGGAALGPLACPPARLLALEDSTTLLGLPGSSPHRPTPGLVWLQATSHPVIAGHNPGLSASTPGAAIAPPPDLPPVARQVRTVTVASPAFTQPRPHLPVNSLGSLLWLVSVVVSVVVTGENHTGGGVDRSGVVRAVTRGNTVSGPGPHPRPTVRGAD